MGMGLNAPIGLTSPTSRPGSPAESSASMASKSSSLGGGLDPGGSADGKLPEEPAAPAALAAAPPPDVSSSDRCRDEPPLRPCARGSSAAQTPSWVPTVAVAARHSSH
eukprot:TRINITY_DN2124_c0_g1_i10.p1 TRINITY_DN2124_c0_g1~~TRINITY_DN2124_c0_g1_i10.p1  ORF type:complete len:108 (-),score=2.14 TRINITY_DN2124_c0_g1_i10:119-442(-)